MHFSDPLRVALAAPVAVQAAALPSDGFAPGGPCYVTSKIGDSNIQGERMVSEIKFKASPDTPPATYCEWFQDEANVNKYKFNLQGCDSENDTGVYVAKVDIAAHEDSAKELQDLAKVSREWWADAASCQTSGWVIPVSK